MATKKSLLAQGKAITDGKRLCTVDQHYEPCFDKTEYIVAHQINDNHWAHARERFDSDDNDKVKRLTLDLALAKIDQYCDGQK